MPTATPTAATPTAATPTAATPTAATPTAATPTAATPTAATPTAAGTSAGGGRSGRLRNGELRGMVAAFLAGNAGEFTSGQIARALGRSSGAVANALVTLEGTGHAAQTSARPLRYTATATTHTVAASPTATPTAMTPTAPSAATAATPPTATSAPPRTPARVTPAVAAPGAARSGPARSDAARSGAAGSGRAGSGRPGGGEVVSGPVVRPNGSLYHPRVVAGLPDVADVTALRRLRAAGVAALLYGPPGTGKTSVVEAAFPELVTVAGDADTTVADLVGEYTQTPEGRYVFVEGPLVRAMREGRCLFLDDATLISPTVLAVVYPAMDGRREVVVKANGGQVVTAGEGFYVVAGHNPGVHGAVLSDALSSRFSAQIRVSTDYELAAQLGIDSRAVRAARNLSTRVESGEIGWAPQLRELLAFQKISVVLGVEAAAGNLIGVAPEEDRDTVASVLRAAFGNRIAPLALGPQLALTPTPPTAPTRATPAAPPTSPVASAPATRPAAPAAAASVPATASTPPPARRASTPSGSTPSGSRTP